MIMPGREWFFSFDQGLRHEIIDYSSSLLISVSTCYKGCVRIYIRQGMYNQYVRYVDTATLVNTLLVVCFRRDLSFVLRRGGNQK